MSPKSMTLMRTTPMTVEEGRGTQRDQRDPQVEDRGGNRADVTTTGDKAAEETPTAAGTAPPPDPVATVPQGVRVATAPDHNPAGGATDRPTRRKAAEGGRADVSRREENRRAIPEPAVHQGSRPVGPLIVHPTLVLMCHSHNRCNQRKWRSRWSQGIREKTA